MTTLHGDNSKIGDIVKLLGQYYLITDYKGASEDGHINFELTPIPYLKAQWNILLNWITFK